MTRRHFDKEKTRQLFQKAVGDKDPFVFAMDAGVSPSNFKHYLNDDVSDPPSRKMLKRIADGSDGRVTEPQLLSAGGYDAAVIRINENIDTDKYIEEAALNIRYGIETMSGSAIKYASVEDFLKDIIVLYGPAPHPIYREAKIRISSEYEYHGPGRKSAEYYRHCSITYIKNEKIARLSFILFYCKTQRNGIIISDSAFDMATLIDMYNPNAGKFLFDLSEKGDVKYTDHKMILDVAMRDMTAEKKLLEAIFSGIEEERD